MVWIGTSVLDCPWDQDIPLLSSAINHVLSLFFLSFAASFLTILFSQVIIFPVALLCIISCWPTFFCAMQKLVEVFQLRPYEYWTSWKHSSCFPFFYQHDGCWSLFLFWFIIGIPHSPKIYSCSRSCVLQLTNKSTMPWTSHYWNSPCFFQDISPNQHNSFESQFKYS